MEASVSPISTSSPRESPSYVSKGPRDLLSSPCRSLQRPLPSKCTSSTPISRNAFEDGVNAHLSSAKYLDRSMKSEKRKDAARRHLLGTMYSKQNDVKRSFSFVAGEKQQPDVKFPMVSRMYAKNKCADVRGGSGNLINSAFAQTYLHDRPKSEAHKGSSGGDFSFNERKVSGNNKRGHKISLPEIIMEFNLEASMAANGQHELVITRADMDEDERALGVSYEEFLNKPKQTTCNPCKAKYRPVTPGLLAALNESKMPSKLKTEQWVRSLQTSRKSYCGSSYKIGNLDNSNLAVPNWIYENR